MDVNVANVYTTHQTMHNSFKLKKSEPKHKSQVCVWTEIVICNLFNALKKSVKNPQIKRRKNCPVYL